jgi:hypothetical protein
MSADLLDRGADVLALPCDVTDREQVNPDGASCTACEALPKDVPTSVG